MPFKFGIYDCSTDLLLKIISANNEDEAEQEAQCFVGEEGIDREFGYEGVEVRLIEE